jgi:hypothetical protein
MIMVCGVQRQTSWNLQFVEDLPITSQWFLQQNYKRYATFEEAQEEYQNG